MLMESVREFFKLSFEAKELQISQPTRFRKATLKNVVEEAKVEQLNGKLPNTSGLEPKQYVTFEYNE